MAATSSHEPRPFEPGEYSNGALSLAVPAELVELVAERVAARLAATGEQMANGRARAHGQRDREALSVTDPGSARRLTLTKVEAAEALGVSVDHLERHVLPGLRIVRSGRLRLIPVSELEDWIEQSAARAPEGRG
jgi:excisionase family DNA binding protein